MKKISLKRIGTTVGSTLALGASAIIPFAAAGGEKEYTSVISGPLKAVADMIDALTGDIANVGIVIAAIALVVAFITAMIAKDDKVAQAAWKWVKRILICGIALFCVKGISALLETIGGKLNESMEK